jgi:hypothetical protein
MQGDKVMDHGKYQKRLKNLDLNALLFIIQDAREAIANNPDNLNNGYYADEICYASQELRRRGITRTYELST